VRLKNCLNPTRRRVNPGAALIVTLVFTAVGLMVLGSVLNWGSNNAGIIERNNEYFKVLSAAEAATERVVAGLVTDYQKDGEAGVNSKLGTYATWVPTSADDPYWANYEFNNATGVSNRTYISRTVDHVYTNVGNQYSGLKGMSSTYRVVSNARALNYPIVGGIKQELQVSTVPVFQFAIFYTVDLEINPGANMQVGGRVHSNHDIYCQPDSATLTFQSDVTACGGIFQTIKPGDPGTGRAQGTVIYATNHTGGNATLTLPIGTNNTPEAVYEILKPPPASETASDPMYANRYYNKADLIILVSNTTVTAKAGSTTIPWQQISNFVNTNITVFNKREDATVRTTQIDVGKLTAWAHTNTTIAGTVGNDNLDSIYVADFRTTNSSTERGVRLTNGAALPPKGLTVASPNPVYIKGHYNAPVAARGTHDTSGTKPASIAADAITILSENWKDQKSTDTVDNRPATATTVNAAFLSGIVPTANGFYSGGVENFPRFLEKWTDVKFTYNGSMVVMFYSQQATSPQGSHTDVYAPPDRDWAFDVNFLDSTRLPPDTPQFRKISRWLWTFMAPNTIN